MTARVSIWCSASELTDADAAVQNPFTEQAGPNSYKWPACRWTDIISDAGNDSAASVSVRGFELIWQKNVWKLW